MGMATPPPLRGEGCFAVALPVAQDLAISSTAGLGTVAPVAGLQRYHSGRVRVLAPVVELGFPRLHRVAALGLG